MLGAKDRRKHATEPQRVAGQLLDRLWDEFLPIDPIPISKALGLQVYTLGLQGVVSMADKRPGYDPRIFLNESDSPGRKRFSCAYEFGYYVKHSESGEEEWGHINRDHWLRRHSVHPTEDFAREFAMALLMPECALDQAFGCCDGAHDLGEFFGVPSDVISYFLDEQRQH